MQSAIDIHWSQQEPSHYILLINQKDNIQVHLNKLECRGQGHLFQ